MSGSLRNSRGTKVTVILLDTVMVVGRTVSRPGIGKIIQVRHQSIHQPIIEWINRPGVPGSHPPALPGLCGSGGWGGGQARILSSSCNSSLKCYPPIN